MRTARRRFLAAAGGTLLAGSGRLRLGAQSRRRQDPDPLPEGLLARLDLGAGDGASGGTLPVGADAIAGRWSRKASDQSLEAAPEPLLDAWLEFGPEIRERGASIVASACAPGGGRLRSRFGVGLYGKNGFQLRLAPARQAVELVRRGAVLLHRPLAHDPGQVRHLELSVAGERVNWIVSGRSWEGEEERPEEALFELRILGAELEVPLAGRSVLFATPFSGEPVSFRSAAVYREGFAWSDES